MRLLMAPGCLCPLFASLRPPSSQFAGKLEFMLDTGVTPEAVTNLKEMNQGFAKRAPFREWEPYDRRELQVIVRERCPARPIVRNQQQIRTVAFRG